MSAQPKAAGVPSPCINVCRIDQRVEVDAGAFISGVLGRPPVSRVARAVLAKRPVAEEL